MISHHFRVHFNHIPLAKSRTVRNNDIMVIFGKLRNNGVRRKIATGRL